MDMTVARRFLTILALTVAWNASPVLAQGSATPPAGRGQDAGLASQGDDLMREMTELIGQSGIASNGDLSGNLSALLRDPNLQSLMRAVLEAGSLEPEAGVTGSASQLSGILLSSVAGLLALVVAGAILLVRIVFAIGVFIAARRIAARGSPTLFIGPVLWSLAVVCGGLLVVALYWLLHHSTLSRLPSLSPGR